MQCQHCGYDIPSDAHNKCPECKGSLSAGPFLFRVIAAVEDIVISFVLISMVFMVLLQIVLRNFYSTGVSGGAEIVRHLLLWVAFLGAAIAAREGKHIKIDLAQRILHSGPRNFVEFLTGLFTTTICAILLYASIQFVKSEYSLGTVIPFCNLKVWMLELVIPFGYCVVMLRYFARSMESFVCMIKGE